MADYIYSISGIPGGVFGGQQSDHLLDMIQTILPSAPNPVISSDGTNVTVTFDTELSAGDITTLNGLVARCADYFIVTSDGGLTDLGLPALISVVAGLVSSTTVTLQYKSGDGSDSNGYGDAISISAPIMNITALGGAFNGSGKFQFTIGSHTQRGQADITLTSGSLPVRILNARWT